VGKSHSQPNSQTSGSRPRPQRSNNNDNAPGSQATGRSQQPPLGGNPQQPNHQNPPEDLRQKINEGRDALSIFDSRHREHEVADTEGTDCSDHFLAFTARFSNYKYPEGFKPIGITKYDGKQAPQQWLRWYSTVIDVAGGSNITKVIYFPMALDPALLTWLESLSNNSIDSWERLKKSSSTTSRGRSLVQVPIMTLLNVSRNVMSSYGHTHAIFSTCEPPLRTSWRRTLSTASTMASPTQAFKETLGGICQTRGHRAGHVM
jgi:hypothetical protein